MAKRTRTTPKTATPKAKDFPPKLGSGGSPAELRRNKKGDIVATLKEDFGGITQKNLKESRKAAANNGNRNFTGAPAPRTGGKQAVIAKSGPVKGGTKSQVKASKRRVNKSSASPQAKRSAKKLY